MSEQRAQHTPGPWLRDGNTIYTLQHNGWYKGQEQFRNRLHISLQPGPPDMTQEEWEANGNLIAAAPELLAACECLVSAADEHDSPIEAIDRARTALRKAKGESQ